MKRSCSEEAIPVREPKSSLNIKRENINSIKPICSEPKCKKYEEKECLEDLMKDSYSIGQVKFSLEQSAFRPFCQIKGKLQEIAGCNIQDPFN